MVDGRSVKLRSWHKEDIPKLMQMRNDIKLQSLLLCRVKGSNAKQTRQWLQKRSLGPGNLLLIVAAKDNNAPLGYVQFTDIEPIDKTAKLGICLAPEAQGKGIGQEVLLSAFKHLHNCSAVRKVILEVRSDNKRAIKCYKRIGFKQCGKYLQHKYIGGKWHDLIFMELFLSAILKS